MIYRVVKGALLSLLKAPSGPPSEPAGSPGSATTFRASRNFLAYRLTLYAIGVVPAVLLTAGALMVAVYQHASTEAVVGAAIANGMAILGAISGYFLTRLEYDMRYYVVTDRSLRIRQGVVWIREMTLTYANVQHIAVEQGPLQRLFGIADVIVKTAGGAMMMGKDEPIFAGHVGVLRGVDNAAELRDRIQAHLSLRRDAGLGDPEDRHHAGWSPAAAAVLREIRDELKLWRSPDVHG